MGQGWLKVDFDVGWVIQDLSDEMLGLEDWANKQSRKMIYQMA